jgi:hypothetical protein
MSNETGPSQSVIKRLFAKSGNRCAFTDCPFELVQGKTFIGEICHIKAASPNGPRYDPKQTAAERHAYENLVLMCANHHSMIDNDPDTYTVDSLASMKADHEKSGTVLPADEINRGAKRLIDQSVTAINQSGGIAAHTVHQTVHVHPPATPAVPSDDRQSIIARARQFHIERIAKIIGAAPPVALMDGGKFVLHVVPFSAVDSQPSSAFDKISNNPSHFPPIASDFPRGFRVSFDGLLTGSNAEGLTKPQRAYVLVFRSGAVEAVASSLARGREHNFIMLPQIQAMAIKYACFYARSLKNFGIQGPLIILTSLVDVQGMRLVQDFLGNGIPEDLSFGPLNHSQLQFDLSILETIPTDYNECAKQLKSTLTHMANTAELTSSPYFDPEGNYTLKL